MKSGLFAGVQVDGQQEGMKIHAQIHTHTHTEGVCQHIVELLHFKVDEADFKIIGLLNLGLTPNNKGCMDFIGHSRVK